MKYQGKLILGLAILVIIYVFFAFDIPYKNTVDDFATCVSAGNPIMESYPARCTDSKGNTYTQEIPNPSGTSTASDMIRVTSPKNNMAVESPLVVSGEARGNWYFEASSPVEILGNDGSILGTGYVQAQGDWMTESFVPFSGNIVFKPGKNTSGIVRFKNDNPSGDPIRDLHFDVPVTFKVPVVTTKKPCKIGGCSSQLCSDKDDLVSTCEYRLEYACYKTAECKRQADGECGWTQDTELLSCLNSN